METGGGGLDEVCRVTCWSSANKFRVGRGATATSRRLRPATVVININNSREERAGTSLPATARTRSERHDKVHRLSQNEAQHSGIAAPLDMSGARTRHLGIFKNQLKQQQQYSVPVYTCRKRPAYQIADTESGTQHTAAAV